jgi:hypothetical protein
VGLGAVLSRHRQVAIRLDLTGVKGRLDCLLSGEPQSVTDLHLLRDPYLLSDLLGCLWGGDRASALAALVAPDLASRFSPSAFSSHIEGLLTELAQNPADTHRWMLLWHHVGQARLEPEATRRLDAILAGPDLDGSFQRDSAILTPLMDLAVRNASDRDRIASYINRWANGIDSGNYPTPGFVEEFGTEAREAFIERLIHWTHGLASGIRKTRTPNSRACSTVWSCVPGPLPHTCASR